jgi:hypothetical protein
MNITLPTIAAVSAALILAPVAHADPGDDANYREQLAQYGIAGDANAIAWGYRTCDYVSHGIPPLVEAHELIENSPQLTQKQAEAEVDAAIMSYCISVLGRGVQIIQL